MPMTPPFPTIEWLLVLATLALAGLLIAAFAAWRMARQWQQAQALLQRSRAEAHALASLLDVWQWRTDAQHRLVHWQAPPGHPHAANTLVPTQPLVWAHLQAMDDEAAAALQGQLQQHTRVHALRVQWRMPNGASQDGTLNAVPVLDHTGRFCGHLGTARELLAPKPLQSEPASTPAAAEVAELHASTSAAASAALSAAEATAAFNAQQEDQASFSYTVSHDLRAPIRVVEGFTKIVKEDYGRLLDRVGNDHLDRVLGAAARMNSMIDSLLALSQLSTRPLARQPVNLSQLAGYILDDLRRQSPEREVQAHIEPGLVAQGDATLLRVALENLLGNAWKYTGKCRNAQIWLERSEHEGRPAFTVRDNGAGFDMRFADRLFGVFQRLHSANDFQGTGVGLASVRRIVRRHGGDIWAEGEVDRGARFQFWITE